MRPLYYFTLMEIGQSRKNHEIFKRMRQKGNTGIDMISVGGSQRYGRIWIYDRTTPVTIDECMIRCQVVRRGADEIFVQRQEKL